LRKIAAIGLWGILLFNWVGYRLLNNILENDASRRLEATLDQEQYDDDQLITIKVPLAHLAYLNSTPGFERAEGQIEVNGIPYRYVKRRIFEDSLEMMCIPNQKVLQLRQSGNNYFNSVTGIGQGSKSASHPRNHKSFQSDPYIGIGQVRADAPRLSSITRSFDHSPALSSLALPTDERPPARLAA
jgi:hypothetical protein